MKVLHLTASISAGGAELHLLTLCRYLKERGVHIRIACLRDPVIGFRSLRTEFEEEGFPVTDLDGDSRYKFGYLLRLKALLKIECPDIVHTHLPRADIAGTLTARKKILGPILISSVHGLYRDRWFGHIAAPAMRWSYRRADGVIAISNAVKTWLVEGMGVPDRRIHVIHYDIETKRFSQPPDVPKLLARKGPMPVIGSVGRLEPGKGFEYLIRAAPHVLAHFPSLAVQIAGHDPLGYGERLRTLIKSQGVEKNVQLVGFRSDIPEFLKGLDIFSFTSLSEGFGQVVVEAMAAGVPVITWRIPPMTEIVVDDETGFLVEPFNDKAFVEAILRLLNQPQLAKQMGVAGQRRAELHFNARGMADQVLNLYTRLFNAKMQISST